MGGHMNTAFEMALEARLIWLQVRSYGALGLHHAAGCLAQDAYAIVEQLAENQARCELPYASPYGAICPLVLRDVSRLAELYEQAWNQGLMLVEEERQEMAERLRRKQFLARAEDCIARNDWTSLDLPSPEHLSAELYAGKVMRIEGHTLDFDEGVVWMDNPYGVPGCLGDEPTVQLCRQFLIRIAKGGMYGPEP